MNKKVLAALFGLIILIGFGTYFLSKPSKPDTLEIGVISGTVGEWGFVGENFNRGLMLAHKEWLENHPNSQVRLIIEEDEFDGKKGLSAYQKLVNIDNIDALINLTTFTLDNIYDLVSKTDIPVAQAFIQSQEEKDDNILQLWPGTIPGQIELGKTVKEKGYENVVVLVAQTSSGYQKFADGFKKGYNGNVTEIKVPADESGLRTIALKSLSSNPDAIVFIIDPKTGGLLLKEIEALKKTPVRYVFDSNIVGGFENYTSLLSDPNVLNGSILFTIPSEFTEDFTNKYKAEYGQEPGLASDMGYDAFMLLMNNYSDDNKKWIENMKDYKAEGAGGEIKFDEVGVRIPRIVIGTIENGQLPK